MIQVIQRALAILEFLASSGDEGRPLAEIALKLGLNKATCVNILKTLTALNMAEQIAPRKGYRLGPVAYTLARGDGGAYRALARAAEPSIEALAGEVRETVLLAILRGDQRFTLCQVNGTQEVQIRDFPSVTTNVYELATGRLLLAYARPETVSAVVAAQGYPGPRWDGIETAEQLATALAAIRREGRVILAANHVMGIAYPVQKADQIEAALGLFLPKYRFVDEHREAILAGMSRTAMDISWELTRPMVESVARLRASAMEAMRGVPRHLLAGLGLPVDKTKGT